MALVSNISHILVNHGAVSYGKKGLSSGSISRYYIDVSKPLGYQDVAALLANQLCQMMDKNSTCVASNGRGMVLADQVRAQNNSRLTQVEKQTKAYGTASRFHFYEPTRRDSYTIVDDVFTSGGTVTDIVKAIRETGARVNDVCVVVDRSEDELIFDDPDTKKKFLKTREDWKSLGVPLKSLVKSKEIIELYQKY